MQRITNNEYSQIKNAPPALANAATPAELITSSIDRSALANAAIPAEPSPVCPLSICDGTGWQAQPMRADPRFRQLVPCACRIQARERQAQQEQRQRRAQLLAQFESELGGKLAACTLENYFLDWAVDGAALQSMAAARAACQLFADNPAGWLYLHGATGVGKSHLAAATARRIAELHSFATSYTTETALVAFLRQGWGKQGDQSTDARMQALQEVDLLVLDDIGTAFRGRGEQAWVDAQLFELLQPRYLNSRRTILTSNLPVQDLEQRLASRIKGEAVIIFLDNADQREIDHG